MGELDIIRQEQKDWEEHDKFILSEDPDFDTLIRRSHNCFICCIICNSCIVVSDYRKYTDQVSAHSAHDFRITICAVCIEEEEIQKKDTRILTLLSKRIINNCIAIRHIKKILGQKEGIHVNSVNDKMVFVHSDSILESIRPKSIVSTMFLNTSTMEYENRIGIDSDLIGI